MADGMAIEGMKLIKNSLIKAFTNGKDVNARMDYFQRLQWARLHFRRVWEQSTH